MRPVGTGDRTWVSWVLEQRWGSAEVVSRGRTHRADALPALVAEVSGERCGLATYLIDGAEAELVSLDALRARRGIGTVLLAATVEAARSAGCRRLRLSTTNDNLDAMRFYQRRGLRIVAVRVGAVDDARLRKPQIPEIGEYGIALHDEIELAVDL